MGSRRNPTRTQRAAPSRFLGLPVMVLAAGLSAGLAIPAALNTWDKIPFPAREPIQSQSASALPAKTPDPKPILAVLDPATLVGKVPQSSPVDPGPEPVETARLTIPAPAVSAPEPPTAEIGEVETEILPRDAIPAMLTPAPDVAREARTTIILVEPGDTLIDILNATGASRRDANNAIAALKPLFNIRGLRVGQKITITSTPAEEGNWQLSQVSVKTDVDRQVRVRRSDDGIFAGEEVVTELRKEAAFTGGEINSSLYLAAGRDGLPAHTVVKLIRVFSYGVDFQREIKPGDSYQVLYETFSDAAGTELKQGELLYAMLQLGSRKLALYRFKTADGFVDYYNKKGQSIKRLLMRTPVDGARLSSSFGKRRHPILGYTKMHTGTDFAAPRGTPIMAAGNGILKYAGRKGGYGIYIRIRHNGTYSTAYAHMNGLARGMKKGKRVSQGQVIGYVGSTGRSTGNHLHYEVRQNGKPVNPMGLRLPVGRELAGKDLKAFRRQVAKVQGMMRDLPPPLREARSQVPRSSTKPVSFNLSPALGRGR